MAGEWWRGAVIYQIYPRSFRDSNGDGVGDLPGIVAGLDHIASLGVDGVWLSPFFPSPMRDFGYDVSDYCGVDPLFGTLDDARRVIEACHARGLRVIIDQVWAHSSDQHPWFAESRATRDGAKADWYVWVDPKPDGTPPNNWLGAFGGPGWTWDGRRGQYYFHNYLPQQPQLNVRNPAVQAAILDVARFWLDLGVDGFRLDVANYFMHDPLLRDNPPRDEPALPAPFWYQRHIHNKSHPDNLAFLERIRALLDCYDERFAVAEILDEDNLARMAEYTSGRRLHAAYSFHLLRGPCDARFIAKSVESFFAHPGAPWPCWSFSNHDVIRVVTRWAPKDQTLRPRFAALANALITSLPGTSFLYQGEELGLTNVDVPRDRLVDPEAIANWPRHRNRDGARTPMPWRADAPDLGFGARDPWLPFGPDHAAMAVDLGAADPGSVMNRLRDHLAWRRSVPGLAGGAARFFAAPDGLLAFERQATDRRIGFVFNLTEAPRIFCDMAGAALIRGDGVLGADGIRLPPLGHAIVALRGG